MRKQKKIFQHKFADRFPAVAAIVLMLAGLTIVQVAGAIINAPFRAIPGYTPEGFIGFVISSLIFLWIYKRWFYPEFEGNLRGGNPREGIRLSLLILIYWVIIFPVQFLFTPAVFGWPTFTSLSLALTAGFTEEIAFRGLPVSLLMRQWRDEKKILTTVILTSVVFGAIHLTNLGAGADFGSTILQTIGATAMGLFFCGIYLRSGNLWISIAVHALHDYLCFLDVGGIHDGVVVQEVTWFSFLDLALAVFLGVMGIWMIRPSKRAEIRALWNRKWNITDAPEAADVLMEADVTPETDIPAKADAPAEAE